MSDQSEGNAAVESTEMPMTPLKALLVLLGIIVVVGGFIGINSALGIHEYWAGFLFLLYWAGIEHVDFDKLSACVLGSVVGLTMAWLLGALPGWFGEAAGGLIFLGLILVLIYCQIMGWVSTAVNMVTMVFLTAGTISAVQSGVNFAHAYIALGLAFAYFIGLVWIGMRVREQKAPASSAA